MTDYSQRINALSATLAATQIEALLLEKPLDIYYLTGCSVSTGSLLILPTEAFLLVDSRYIESCRQQSPIEAILKEENTLKDLLLNRRLATLGFDAHFMTVSSYDSLTKQLGISVKLKGLPSPTATLRSIKDKDEQQKLAAAALLAGRGFDYVLSLLKVGITERQLATALQIFWLQQGGSNLSFDSIIAFGPNSALPHHHPTDKPLHDNEIVLIDIGVELDHYQSDMTRTVFFGSPPSAELERIYAIVAEAQQRAQRHCKAGISAGDLDNIARSYIAEHGYGSQFSHSLGHGIGLQTHEDPFLRNKPPYDSVILKKGMAITIEPGIYLPGSGGVRLENSVIVESEGCRDLTQRPM